MRTGPRGRPPPAAPAPPPPAMGAPGRPGRPGLWALLPPLLLLLLARAVEPAGPAAPPPPPPTPRHPWALGRCRQLSGLLRQKAAAVSRLQAALAAAEQRAGLAAAESPFQARALALFQRELAASESAVFQALRGLRRALQGDPRDLANVRESSRQRLEALREAAIEEEAAYVELLAAEKHQAAALQLARRGNRSLSVLDGVLEDVRRAADRLEEAIEERAFDDNKAVKGVNVEAVLRVEEEEEADAPRNLSRREAEGDLGLSLLIDSQNNQYVLTRPRDATVPRADQHLVKDIVAIGVLALPLGWLCSAAGLPTLFGYILCGLLLGPSGLNSIKSLVQVETLGEFGVFFTLFLVGLEFSAEKLRKVWRVALQGPCGLLLLMTACGLLWGHLLRVGPAQSLFLAACLSLSSTPLVSRFLAGSGRADKEGDPEHSAVLLGMLVTQDVQLGLLMAAMPTLAQAGAGTHPSPLGEALRLLAVLARTLLLLAGGWLLRLGARTLVLGPCCRRLRVEGRGSRELRVLGVCALLFSTLTAAELLAVSPELGCFLAGALVSAQGRAVAEEVVSCAGPIRDFLAVFFFASIGLHVFPTFVVYELTVLLVLTLCVVGTKFVLAALVLALLLPRASGHVKWVVAAGLAQVSEFSFVLGSRARRAGIISREAYLLVLSVTALSLLLAPVLWRAALARCPPRPPRAERRPSI